MDIDSLIPPRRAPRAPAGLRRGGEARRLWAGVYGGWQLRPDEAAIFAGAVSTLDEIEQMRATLSKTPGFLMLGGRGSVIAHPLLAEVRKHQASLLKLLAYLGLDAADGSGTAGQLAGRALVAQRWSRRGGG